MKGSVSWFTVSLAIECLPGVHVTVPVSVEFASKDVADLALGHVQKAHPGAYLVECFPSSLLEEELALRVEVFRRRDAAYRELFLAGGGAGD